MKKLYILLATVLLSASLWAQAPQKFSYQSVIRDASNTLVVNQKVGVAVSILQSSELGNVVFKETHYPTTNSNGLASLAIGTGSKVDGDFSKIDWAKGPYFVKTETDITGGTNYTITTISELLSVPYALFAANSQPGPKGDKGDTGAEGTAGKDGVEGKDGAVGPKGDTGAVGPQGPAGLPGKDGINGADGKDGAVGPLGPKGDTGAVGPQGPAGLPGKDGVNGKDGINGADGKDGNVGPIGPKGDTGSAGAQGSAGLPGKDGLNGKDGKDGINGADGKDGKDGNVGPIGPKGDTGAVGAQGPAGLPGKDGVNGKDGKDGINGADGKDGNAGPIGPKGDTGTVGAQGIKGDKGDKGDIGIEGPAGKDGKNGVDGKVEFQNLRVSKTGDTLYLTNGNFVVIPGLSAANAGTNTPPTSGYGPNVTDVDGNSYKTVYVGTQQWMGENLKTAKYSDGTAIPNVTDNTEWSNLTTDAWSYYNNDAANNTKYGKLYNWYASSPTTNGNKNVCPSGWHVPNSEDWSVIIEYLGGEGIAGDKMREVGSTNWGTSNTGNNLSNMTGLPAGWRDGSNGIFGALGTNCFWWSNSEFTSTNAWLIDIGSYAPRAFRNEHYKKTGFSIRCLKDADNTNNQPIQGSIQTIDCGGATNNGTLTSNTASSSVSSILAYTGGNGGTYASQAIASTGVTGLTATLSAGTFANGNGNLTYTITGTPTASGTAKFDISIGGKTCTLTRTIVQPTNGFGPNISDIDGNSYKTVYIGTQQWMAENLKTAKYNDGSIIKDWSTDTIGSWCYFENDTNYNNKSGKLYNWYALGKQKICPIGWHVPTENEWQILTDYLGGWGVAGGKMKQTDTLNWTKPNAGATNSTLFNAVPGGTRLNNTFFYWPTNYSYLWSSSEVENDKTIAYYHQLFYDQTWFTSDKGNKLAALSVRCLKD